MASFGNKLPRGNENNCWKSCTPSRVVFLSRPACEGYRCLAHNYIWIDFPPETVDLFQAAFHKRKDKMLPRITIEIDHAKTMVDFTSMIMFDQMTLCARSIAWMDIHGRWFVLGHQKERGMCNEGTQGMVTGPSVYVIYRPRVQDSGPFNSPIIPDLNLGLPAWRYES